MSDAKFHGDSHEILPWNASYTFPTTSVKVFKQTIKIQPKNGGTYSTQAGANRLIFEFPADNYGNMLNTVLSFDLTVSSEKDGKMMYAGPGVVPAGRSSEASAAYPHGYQDFVDPSGQSGILIIDDTDNSRYAAWITDVRAAVPDFFYGWFFRITSGLHAGACTRIIGMTLRTGTTKDDVPFSNAPFFKFEDKTLMDKYSAANNDTFEIIPGWRLQKGGVHNLFQRLRVLYGSMPLEDINQYSTMSRQYSNWGIQRAYHGSIGAILDGTVDSNMSSPYSQNYGGDSYIATGSANPVLDALNQGFDGCHDSFALLKRSQGVNIEQQPRTFQVQLNSGILASQKLIPFKWMAAALRLEIDLTQSYQALITGGSDDVQFKLTNLNMITELLEFNDLYDANFYGALKFGIPLKFTTWDNFYHTFTGAKLDAIIQERALSLKYMFHVLKDQKCNSLYLDSDRSFHALGETYEVNADTNVGTALFRSRTPYLSNPGDLPISDFWYRIGGSYMPAQPVQCTRGGSEAYSELMKVVDYLGDYTRSNSITPYTWSSRYLGGGGDFCIATSFENNDLFPDTISGINCQEQSDVMLIINCKDSDRPGGSTGGSTATGVKSLYTFAAYDALLIIKEGNDVKIVK